MTWLIGEIIRDNRRKSAKARALTSQGAPLDDLNTCFPPRGWRNRRRMCWRSRRRDVQTIVDERIAAACRYAFNLIEYSHIHMRIYSFYSKCVKRSNMFE